MNEKNIRKLIEHLKKVPRRSFDLSTWLSKDGCGTVGCIAGHAHTLMLEEEGRHITWQEGRHITWHRGTLEHMAQMSSGDAAEWLGLSYPKAEALFVPNGDDTVTVGGVRTHPYAAPKEAAIAVLEHLLETGEVSWVVSIPWVEEWNSTR